MEYIEEQVANGDMNEARYPRIGDIVLFYGDQSGAILPAIITHAWSEDCVNLYVFGDGSHSPDKTVVFPTSVLHERVTSPDNPRWCYR